MASSPRSVTRVVAPSGLVVLAERMPECPTATVVLSVLAGTRREPRGLEGLATLTADALLEGAAGRGAEELAWAIDSVGASVDVLTGYEAGRIVATCLGESVPDIIRLVADVAYRPGFAESAVERSRRRLLREIEEEQDDPYTVSQRALFRLVFGDHPRGRAGIGTTEGVSACGVEDVRAFHGSRFRPDTSVLSVAGRFDVDAVLRAAEALVAPAGEHEETAIPEPSPLPPASELVPREGEQAHLAIGTTGIRRTDPLYIPAALLDVIFGDSAGFASRLAARLREGDGLAYLVEGDVVGTSGVDPGLVWIYTATSPDRSREALAAVEAEMRRASGGPPTARELRTAVAFLKGRRILERETAEARAASLVRMERYDLGFDYDERYPALLDAVTVEDVAEAAARLLDVSRCSVVSVGPLDEPLPLPAEETL